VTPRGALPLLACALLLAGCAGSGPSKATPAPTLPAATATSSPPPSVTATRSATPFATASRPPTASPSASPSATGVPSATPTPSPSPTATIDDTLPAALDNGADGRNPFNSPDDVRPADACADTLHASDESLVLRILPRGPLNAGGGLAFTAGACVYLPPGYLDSGLEYPVLYLLHGGGGDQADWIAQGNLPAIMDAAIAADSTAAAIVVTPDGTDGWWFDSISGDLRNERYVLDHLIPYVDRHFRTIATRAGRAIDGLSNGGYGAMHLAAKAPHTFAVAGAMSANLAGLSFTGLAAGTAPAYARGSLPAHLASNLDGIDLTMDIGTVCIADQAIDNCLTYQFEQIFVPANREFSARVTAVREAGDGVLEYREGEGAHAWRWWTPWLRDRHLPFLLARLDDPRPDGTVDPAPTPPAAFRYRSVAADFTVWDYQVTVTRDVREFLDLTDVRAEGLTVQGSGRAVIRTAPIYDPGATYLVEGAGGQPQAIVAGPNGRLRITVDLGPSHQFEQFTPKANAAEAAGGYWTVRTVVISELEGAASAAPVGARSQAQCDRPRGSAALQDHAPA
jgi:S-formylglutathione hydrolase FrmB